MNKNRHNTVLTVKQVRLIKDLLLNPELKQGAIAVRFGVSRATINRIKNKRAWGDV